MSQENNLELALTHLRAGRVDDAETLFNEVLNSEPTHPNALHFLGLVKIEQGQEKAALELMEKSLSLSPDTPHFHHNISGLYRRLGRLKEAEACLRQAINLKQEYAEPYHALAELVQFESDDPFITIVAEQLKKPDLSKQSQLHFHFAAAKMLDGSGDYPQAFKHIKQANLLAERPFNSSSFRSYVKDILYIFSRARTKQMSSYGLDSNRPTFIVGMPRSGTTLIEQILASHSRVFGAGELNDIKGISVYAQQLSGLDAPYPICIQGNSPEDYSAMAAAYLKNIQKLANDHSIEHVIDKHPLNFQFIGLIFAMFPNAKVIHAARNPADTCLSCFFQNFTRGQDYSFNLSSLGHFYNDYSRLMDHWHSLYPGKIHTVQYEELIENQEHETSRLLAFMGLDFEQACIDFHKSNRKVSTASFKQVRQPIYKTSKQKWMRYQEELKELTDIIGQQSD